MNLVSLLCGRLEMRRGIAGGISAAIAIFMLTNSAAAQSLAAGKVVNAMRGTPVIGASVKVQMAGKPDVEVFTDSNGVFSMPLDLQKESELQTLILEAEHRDFEPTSLAIQTEQGTPTKKFYELVLLPRELRQCMSMDGNKIIIGHIRSPADENLGDLSGRIAETMDFDLTTRLQENGLNADLQPTFEECAGAKPKSVKYGGKLANALKVHAFVGGSVKRGELNYDVSTHVSDAYKLFKLPHRSKNLAVDLDDPSSAELNPGTHAAVLIALAKGYEKKGHSSHCVDVATEAEKMAHSADIKSGRLYDMIMNLKEDCKSKLPHKGLLQEKTR